LSGRRICGVCGANYHIKFVPSVKEGVCDKCGGELYQRTDDKLDTVMERMRVYHEQTEDLIEYYKKNGILKEINSDMKIETITKNILDTIKCDTQKMSLINLGVL
jgi:adenylate kinase